MILSTTDSKKRQLESTSSAIVLTPLIWSLWFHWFIISTFLVVSALVCSFTRSCCQQTHLTVRKRSLVSPSGSWFSSSWSHCHHTKQLNIPRLSPFDPSMIYSIICASKFMRVREGKKWNNSWKTRSVINLTIVVVSFKSCLQESKAKNKMMKNISRLKPWFVFFFSFLWGLFFRVSMSFFMPFCQPPLLHVIIFILLPLFSLHFLASFFSLLWWFDCHPNAFMKNKYTEGREWIDTRDRNSKKREEHWES